MNKPVPYKGVTFKHEYRMPFVAQVTIGTKNVCIGRYSNPIDAAKAYDKKVFEINGEFAYLNFPEEVNSNR